MHLSECLHFLILKGFGGNHWNTPFGVWRDIPLTSYLNLLVRSSLVGRPNKEESLFVCISVIQFFSEEIRTSHGQQASHMTSVYLSSISPHTDPTDISKYSVIRQLSLTETLSTEPGHSYSKSTSCDPSRHEAKHRFVSQQLQLDSDGR